MAQLLTQLDCAVARMRDPAAEMLPAISQIVDDLNVARWGAPPFRQRAAAGFVSCSCHCLPSSCAFAPESRRFISMPFSRACFSTPVSCSAPWRAEAQLAMI